MRTISLILLGIYFLSACRSNEERVRDAATSTGFNELHRPQLHFSPPEKWMNDPNGMVYHEGEYHLFYQHHPDGLTWGPMHWGHAISKDLVHWEHLPIALYPDEHGMIFSGSAVVDHKNTTMFGSIGNPPLVAVFTYHNMEREKAGHTDYQSQGIAFSTDRGRSWKMYEGNPVLANQGIKDFRDPKVFWHEETSRWIMILAVSDHVEFWESPDLKSWTKLSEFGRDYGSHGGVWECPDLFRLSLGDGREKWVMLVSINPGGPNLGSATQYFTGEFDGKKFVSDTPPSITKWLDYGPDNYAGVTWSNAPDDRRIFLGWMSNWAYAEKVPTSPWRSAMTLPRDLGLMEADGNIYVTSRLSDEVSELEGKTISKENITVREKFFLNGERVGDLSMSRITVEVEAKDFWIDFSNSSGEHISVGFNSDSNHFFIDRTHAGDSSFFPGYAQRSIAPRLLKSDRINIDLVADISSVEVFFDNGTTAMTAIYFPSEPFTTASVSARQNLLIHQLTVTSLRSIWRKE